MTAFGNFHTTLSWAVHRHQRNYPPNPSSSTSFIDDLNEMFAHLSQPATRPADQLLNHPQPSTVSARLAAELHQTAILSRLLSFLHEIQQHTTDLCMLQPVTQVSHADLNNVNVIQARSQATTAPTTAELPLAQLAVCDQMLQLYDRLEDLFLLILDDGNEGDPRHIDQTASSRPSINIPHPTPHRLYDAVKTGTTIDVYTAGFGEGCENELSVIHPIQLASSPSTVHTLHPLPALDLNELPLPTHHSASYSSLDAAILSVSTPSPPAAIISSNSMTTSSTSSSAEHLDHILVHSNDDKNDDDDEEVDISVQDREEEEEFDETSLSSSPMIRVRLDEGIETLSDTDNDEGLEMGFLF